MVTKSAQGRSWGAIPAKPKEADENQGVGKRTMIHEFMRQIGVPGGGGGGGGS